MVTVNHQLLSELCNQAAVEQDPKKLAELVSEINRIFDDKRRRLNMERRSLPLPTATRTAPVAASQR